MNYRLPKYEDYDILKDYVIEHYANGEEIIASSLFLTSMNYKEWVDKINRNSLNSDDEWGKYYLYLVFDKEKLIGLLNIRYDLSDELKNKYGNIGYGVRPSERNKGYATIMLKKALDICKEKNMKDVILGCYEKNYSSNRVIIKNNGILYNSNYEERKISDELTIKLKCNYYKIIL